MVVVAQLVRASVCGTEGRGFETHLPPKSPDKSPGFFYFNSFRNFSVLLHNCKRGFGSSVCVQGCLESNT